MTAVSPAAIIGLADDALHGRADKDALIGEGCHLQLWRHRGRHAGQNRPNALDHVQRRRIAALQDRDQHAATAVLAHDVGLHLKPVADARYVAQIDSCAVDLLERDICQGFHRARCPVGPYVVFRLADLDRARRHHYTLQRQCIQHIGRSDAFGLHRRLVHIDGNLPLLTAIG